MCHLKNKVKKQIEKEIPIHQIIKHNLSFNDNINLFKRAFYNSIKPLNSIHLGSQTGNLYYFIKS